MQIAALFCACLYIFPLFEASTSALPAQIEGPFRRVTILPQNPAKAQKTDVQIRRKAPIRKRGISYQRGKWFLVNGFTSSVSVYGQVRILGKRDVSGYLYSVSGEQIFIYGQVIAENEIYARDRLGNTYHLNLHHKNRPALYP